VKYEDEQKFRPCPKLRFSKGDCHVTLCMFESLESRRFLSAHLVSIAELIDLSDSRYSKILENVGMSVDAARAPRAEQQALPDAPTMSFEVDGIWAATGSLIRSISPGPFAATRLWVSLPGHIWSAGAAIGASARPR
jgi:hypothetical protein